MIQLARYPGNQIRNTERRICRERPIEGCNDRARQKRLRNQRSVAVISDCQIVPRDFSTRRLPANGRLAVSEAPDATALWKERSEQ
jgi:hypothetical protein